MSMRGRKLFNLFKPILIGLSGICLILPDKIASFLLVIFRYVPTKVGIGLRYIMVHRLAAECGDCVAVFEGVFLLGLQTARFGDHVSIQPMCYLDATGGLAIGSHVSIGHATTIMTTEHDFSHPEVNTRDAPCIMAAVIIGDDVWIGAGVRILAGVSIGNHVVIGAGAVVTKDIPSGSLAVGVPARPRKLATKD
jgi:acetyltransferase-like isoleucine patch superfamily enzyme